MDNDAIETSIYESNLRQSISDARQGLYAFVQRMGYSTVQKELRRLSWMHNHLYNTTASYRNDVDSVLNRFSLPLPIGTSRQDAYHHTHLINSSLCVIFYRPAISTLPTVPLRGAISTCREQIQGEELFGLELQEQIYHTLWELIPKDCKTPTVTPSLETEFGQNPPSDPKAPELPHPLDERLASIEAMLKTILNLLKKE